ncbi:MAG: histidine phosphatase family protein [Acidimicrobiales bacterium]
METSKDLGLWILRHAKAAQIGTDGDITRPLTKNGRHQADLVREHLEALATVERLPTLVISSTAARARETAEAVMPALTGARIEFERDLYTQDADGVVDLIKLLDPDDKSIMIVGHNPTLQDLCVMLAEQSYAQKLEQDGLPTSTLVGLAQRGASSWNELSAGSCSLVHRFVPKPKS